MTQLQFLFGNPKGGKSMKKKKNPQRYGYRKGNGKVKKGIIYLTTAEKKHIADAKAILGKEIVSLDKALKSSKASKSSTMYKSTLKLKTKLQADNRVLRKKIKDAEAMMKKALRESKELKAKGYKAKLITLSKDGTKEVKSKVALGLRKIDKAIDTLKEAKVAKKKTKKKVTKRKVTKKKVTRRKVAKKKVTKKKVTRRKVAKKKVTKRKVAKKVTRRKVAKKKTTKKVTRRKATKRKSAKKKVRKSKPIGVTKFKKKVSKATKKKGGLGKGKSRKFSVKRGKRKYSASIKRYKRNPMGGLNMKLNKILKHNIAEATGLFLGGATHGGVNDLFARFMPNVADRIQRVLGNFSGAFFPIVAGVGLGIASDKLKGKGKEYASSLAKGLIGAGVVGLGATAYETVRPSVPMAGMVQDDLGFDGESDYEIGGYDNQMGVIANSDFDETTSHQEDADDFGVEFDSFEGEFEQLG